MDRSLIDVVESEEEAKESTLATTAFSNDCNRLTCMNSEVKVLNYWRSRGVRKVHIGESDGSTASRKFGSAFAVLD